MACLHDRHNIQDARYFITLLPAVSHGLFVHSSHSCFHPPSFSASEQSCSTPQESMSSQVAAQPSSTACWHVTLAPAWSTKVPQQSAPQDSSGAGASSSVNTNTAQNGGSVRKYVWLHDKVPELVHNQTGGRHSTFKQ